MLSLSKKITIYFLFLQRYCYAKPSVTIDQGRLTGTNVLTHDGQIVSGYLGIPYARPPIGNLRFKAPQPPKRWTGTYRAENGSIHCTQTYKGKISGVEDCLYLNVYTPQVKEESSTLLPVMVGIHGGSFMEGSADPAIYGASYILDRNVVLVTMNYRLGIFGYLSTGDEASPGNYGLKDQTLALRWVQRNIGVFGGDPDRVTLYGFSAGAMSAHILSLSDKTEGLFHKLILQSGTAIGHSGYCDRSQLAKRTRKIAEFFNCPTDNSSLLVRCLRSLDAATLASWRPPVFQLAFVPTNEPESDEAILTDSPQNLLNQGKMRDLPWICGNVRDEGLFVTAYDLVNSTRLEDTVLGLNDTIRTIIGMLDRNDTAGYFEAITDYYFNDWTIDPVKIINNYTTMFGDTFFFYPTVDLMRTQTRIGSQPGFMYLFEYRGTFSSSYDITGNDTDLGVCHGDEGIYLFPRANSTFAKLKKNMSRRDLIMMKKLTELWTFFAAHGQPTLSHWYYTEQWRKYDDRGIYLQIGNNSNPSLIMKTSLYENRMNFWKKLLGQRNSGSEDASAGTVTAVIAGYVILSYVYTY